MALSYEIASPLSFESLQKRLRSRELATPQLNDENRKLFRLPVLQSAIPWQGLRSIDQAEPIGFWCEGSEIRKKGK